MSLLTVSRRPMRTRGTDGGTDQFFPSTFLNEINSLGRRFVSSHPIRHPEKLQLNQ
jgi:hypothetical protein